MRTLWNFAKYIAYIPPTMIENLKRTFTLRRLRKVLCLALLIAAGIAALGPIGSSRAISQAGSASPEENGWRGIDLTGAVDPTPLSSPSCGPCRLPVVLDENFDNVTPPALPPDWLATNALGMPPLWVTSNSGIPNPPADTPPNAAFIDDPVVVSDKRLDSLHFPLAATSAQLTFRHNFNLEASDVDPNLGFDGGVLEISFDGGNTFQDMTSYHGRKTNRDDWIVQTEYGADFWCEIFQAGFREASLTSLIFPASVAIHAIKT